MKKPVEFLQSWPCPASNIWVHWLYRFPLNHQSSDKEEALKLLEPYHEQALIQHNLSLADIYTCEQVHGAQVQLIEPQNTAKYALGVDALVTTTPNLTLGIYVADCAAIYLYDAQARVIGLAHSGKKGTELNILKNTVQVMCQQGATLENIQMLISPCIRPPHYPVDIAAQINAQAIQLGLIVENCTDCMIDTYSDAKLYDSYRRDQGKTGRMLALLALR